MSKYSFFKYRSGLPRDPQGTFIWMTVSDDFLLLHDALPRIFGGPKTIRTYSIPLQNIAYFDITLRSAMQNKNVIGRSLVGGIAAGEEGAVIGAISGAGLTAGEEEWLIVEYLSEQEPYEAHTILLSLGQDSLGIGHNRSMIKQVKKKLKGVRQSQRVLEYLKKDIGEDGTISL